MAENNSGSMWDKLVMQQEMSASEKDLRDKFVAEYLIDLDGWAAAVRIGFLSNIAVTYAQMLLAEPYVQKEIRRLQMEDPSDTKQAAKIRKKQIEAALMREAHRMGPGSSHSSRVAALSALAKINDMDAPTKIKTEMTHRGGIMVVPAIANVEDWEQQAAKEQDKLIAASGEDRQVKKH